MFSLKSELTGLVLPFFFSSTALEISYHGEKSIVGATKYSISQETMDNIDFLPACFGIGHDQFMRANPQLKPGKPIYPGQVLIIPEHIILPKAIPENTIVINMAEKKMYFHHKPSSTLYIFPVGIGRGHTPTPLGKMRIILKRHKPTWNVTKEGLEEAKSMGYENHPKTIPPGPNNPLGDYAIHLSKQNYLIHSTNEPSKIGTQNTAGCINLYRDHIKILFNLAPMNTPIEIIYMPVKLLSKGDTTWIEVHTPPINITEQWSQNPLSPLPETFGQQPPSVKAEIEDMLRNPEKADGIVKTVRP